MFDAVKKNLKKIAIIEYLNSVIKDFILSFETYIQKNYKYYSSKNHSILNDFDVYDFLHKRMLSQNIRPLSPSKNFFNIYFVGTYYDHEGFGFIQSLKRFGNVNIFYNQKGEYGINSSIKHTSKNSIFENGNYLLKNVKEVHSIEAIDFLIGTFTSPTIMSSTLQEIRQLGIPVINFAMDDRLPIHWKETNGIKRGAIGLIDGVDLTLQTTKEFIPRYINKGCPCIYFPFGSDSNIFKPKPVKDIDVLFIGNNYGKRSYLVNKILKAGISIVCYGNNFPNGHLSGEFVPEFFSRAKIILGTGLIGHSSKIVTLKLRDFDAPMSGALYITKFNKDLKEFFKFDDEIIFYENDKDCVEKLKYYLHNIEEREFIANKARLRSMKDHNWDQRIKLLIATLTSKN